MNEPEQPAAKAIVPKLSSTNRLVLFCKDLYSIIRRINNDLDWAYTDRLDFTQAIKLASQLKTEVDEICAYYNKLVEEDALDEDEDEG